MLPIPVDQAIAWLTGSTVTLLAMILVAGSLRVWVYGYIDKAKDAQIERLTTALEKSLDNNRTLLDVMESAKRGRS